MKSARTIIVVVAALGAIASLSMACRGSDPAGEPHAGDDNAVELAPPVRIEVTGESNEQSSAAEMASDASLGAMSIAPEGDMLDDSGFGGDWMWMTTRFVPADSLGALPTDDIAYHYPPGASATIEQVRALAAQLGIEGEPVPGDPDMGSQWVVETADASGARLEVSNDAMVSWWMTGGTRRPDLASGAPTEFGRLDYASGYLADAIPTGPYPLIGLDEALERLTAQWGSWSMAVPAGAGTEYGMKYGTESGMESGIESGTEYETDADAPVASPEAPGQDEPAIDEPFIDETPLIEPGPDPDPGTDPVTELVVELVSVTADLWSSWAADGSMWMLPAYRFEGADGGIYTIAAITDEYLMQMDPYALPDPGRPIVDPPYIEDPFDGLDLDGVSDILVGLTLSEAEELLYENGWPWTLRSVRVNGEDLAVTEDYQTNRVNIVTVDGVITDVVSFG